MSDPKDANLLRIESDVAFLGFALSDCIVELDPQSAKYLRPVNRTALELATHNRFGSEIGGFWLLHDQIAQVEQNRSVHTRHALVEVRSLHHVSIGHEHHMCIALSTVH